MEDLNTIIEDSITDVELPNAPELELEAPVEAPEEPVEATADVDPIETTPVEPEAPTDLGKPVQDDFDKKYGLSAQSSSGRENRIPYSRVKKITEKAVNDAKTAWSKDLTASHIPLPKYTELDTKVKDYESRLGQVAQFEQVMTKEPLRFLQMLNGIPGYAQIFDQLSKGAQQEASAQPAQPVAPVDDVPQPQPDQRLSDGSMVYSMEGLDALNAWNRAKARKEFAAELDTRVKAMESRYAPLERDYQSYQKTQAVLPVVNKQIADARTWPLFNENEDDIVKALNSDQNLSLERAYQTVVYPKMKAEQDRLAGETKVSREAIRAEILKELKAAPRATSTSVGATRPAQAHTSSGPKSLEDVIADSLKAIR